MAIRSETTATAVGLPPAPCPAKTVSPPNFPVDMTRFCPPSTPASGESRCTSVGCTEAKSLSAVLSPRNLADGAIEQLGVVEIHRLEGADGARGNVERIHRHA